MRLARIVAAAVLILGALEVTCSWQTIKGYYDNFLNNEERVNPQRLLYPRYNYGLIPEKVLIFPPRDIKIEVEYIKKEYTWE